MYIKLLTTVAIAASLPATTKAILNLDGDDNSDVTTPTEEGAPPKPALMILSVDNDQQPNDGGEASIASSDGDEITVTTLMVLEDGAEVPPAADGELTITMVPEDGAEPALPTDGEVSITNTAISDEAVTALEPEPEAIAIIESPLVGPTWTAIKYYDAATETLMDVLQSTSITLEFEDDGRLDGHAGCNNYFNSYSDLTDSSFAVDGPMGGTMMMCEEDIMVQEMSYLNIFEGGTINWIISEDQTSLELIDADTDKVIAQYALFSPLIIGPEWTATKYYGSDGLVDVLPNTTITLVMETNERFDGNAGCNNYIGLYDDLTASSFRIDGPVGSTRMACDGADLDDQEFAYLQNFENGLKVEWAVVDDGSLELTDAGTGEVFAIYTAGLEASVDPLSTSGASGPFGTAIVAFALLGVSILV